MESRRSLGFLCPLLFQPVIPRGRFERSSEEGSGGRLESVLKLKRERRIGEECSRYRLFPFLIIVVEMTARD